MKLPPIKRAALCAAFTATVIASGGWFHTRPATGKENNPATLHGTAALEQLKRDGQYDSLQAALSAARLSVNHVAHSLVGRAAWHAPNAAAGYDAYVTEAGVNLSISNKAGNDAAGKDAGTVSLRLRSLGYGGEWQPVAPGKVSGNQQSITIQRENIREWFVNGVDGLEQGFTLDARPPSTVRHPQAALRLALQVGDGWRATANADGQSVSLQGARNQLINYGKLAVRDSAGHDIPAKLTVADEQVVIEVEDRAAIYPLTIDPLFTLQKQLLANDAADFDLFGYAVALDGNTALIGAPYDEVTHTDQGSAYVFVRSGVNWTLQQKLFASDGQPGDKFGSAVALSGDTALIGAPEADEGANTEIGSAYVFVRSGTSWTFQQKLGASGGFAGALFGSAVALDGNTALVGAYQQTLSPSFATTGAAYVFVRSGTHPNVTWTQQQRLLSNDAVDGDRFGFSVALDGDTALIGAPNVTITATTQGSAYIFTRSGTAWTQQPRLNLDSNQARGGDQFGNAVALSGESAAIGVHLHGNNDRGAVALASRNRTTGGWELIQQLLEADNPVTGAHFGASVAMDGGLLVVGASLGLNGTGADQRTAYVYSFVGGGAAFIRQLGAEVGNADDRFGYAVAVKGDTVLVGAYRADAAATDQGAAYVFTLRDSQHVAQPKLLANDGADDDKFGVSVAVSGDTLAVGAFGDDIGTNVNQGSVYIFVRNGTGWVFQQKLTAPDGAASDLFGYAVALSGETLAVGAFNAKIGANTKQGAAYVFVRNGATWTFQQKIFAAAIDGLPNDYFGCAVALEGNTLAVGAYGQNNTRGAGYVFTRTGATWTQQGPKLLANGGTSGDELGAALALSGNTAVLGAPGVDIGTNSRQGAAYVFTRIGTVWTQQQPRLTANDGAADNDFGGAVAVYGNTAAVGAQGNGGGRGAVYEFTYDGVSWTQQPKLTADDGKVGDKFGYAVALSGDTLVAGADNGNNQRGAAYVFTRLGSWRQQQRLIANDGQNGDRFGFSVALSGETIVIGAPEEDSGTTVNQGAAYTFIAPACPALTLNPASLPNGPVGVRYDQLLSVSGGRAGEGFVSVLSGGALPPGLDTDVSGTPTTPGTYHFTITARSVLSQCPAVRSYTLTITPPCPILTVNPASLPGGTVGAAYSQILTGTGGAGQHTLAHTAGTLPPGLSFNPNGLLSGTPAQAGSYTFNITAESLGCTGTRTYTLVIAPATCPAITLNPATLPNATVGVPYSQTLTATGGTTPYTFTLTTGALPPGVNLNAGGALSGTPTAAGPYNFTAQASDANACTGTRNYTLTVNQTLTRAKKGDFDGDGKADLSVWTGATGNWAVRNSGNNQVQNLNWGAGYAPYNDVIVPGDYDGDGKADIAVFRRTGTWFVKRSSNGTNLIQDQGQAGDVPLPANGVR